MPPAALLFRVPKPRAAPRYFGGSRPVRGFQFDQAGAAVLGDLGQQMGQRLAVFRRPQVEKAAAAPAVPVRELGRELMTRQVPALLAVGLLLTAALVGAVVLALREPPAASSGKEPRA